MTNSTTEKPTVTSNASALHDIVCVDASLNQTTSDDLICQYLGFRSNSYLFLVQTPNFSSIQKDALFPVTSSKLNEGGGGAGEGRDFIDMFFPSGL